MTIKDYMNKYIITSNINSNIYEVSKLMQEYDIGFIPITKENKVIGVITDRDIVIGPINNQDTKIKDYITTNILYVNENDNVNKALEIMKKNKIKRLIVINNEQKVTGVISISDLLHINSEEVFKTIIEIYEINRNTKEFDIDVKDFYL